MLRYVASMKTAMFLAQLEEADDETLSEWSTDANRDDRGRYIAILLVHGICMVSTFFPESCLT